MITVPGAFKHLLSRFPLQVRQPANAFARCGLSASIGHGRITPDFHRENFLCYPAHGYKKLQTETASNRFISHLPAH
jgi:hypothetical protein